jgi:hypothetical protein
VLKKQFLLSTHPHALSDMMFWTGCALVRYFAFGNTVWRRPGNMACRLSLNTVYHQYLSVRTWCRNCFVTALVVPALRKYFTQMIACAGFLPVRDHALCEHTICSYVKLSSCLPAHCVFKVAWLQIPFGIWANNNVQH